MGGLPEYEVTKDVRAYSGNVGAWGTTYRIGGTCSDLSTAENSQLAGVNLPLRGREFQNQDPLHSRRVLRVRAEMVHWSLGRAQGPAASRRRRGRA